MTKKDVKLWPWIVFGTLFIVTLWALTPIITQCFYPNDFGLFGDQFGSINSLFSGLAFLGLIIAILLQRKELIDQRKELTLTRNVHETSTKILKQQLEVQFKTNLIQSYNIMIDHLNATIREYIAMRPHEYKSKITEKTVAKQVYLDRLEKLLKSLEDEI